MSEEEQNKLWGGLQELGIEVRYVWTPHQKGFIESGFDYFQSAAALIDAANIGRTRGEFERATKALIRVHAGSRHPAKCGFIQMVELAERWLACMTWLNGQAKEGRLQKGIPDERWARSVAERPLAPLPADKVWIFFPETRELEIRAGHVVPHVKGIGPIPFCAPELFAELGTGYRVIVRFDPSEYALGAAIFNNESGTVNRRGWKIGEYIGHAAFAGFAPQFCAAEGFQTAGIEQRKRFHNFNQTAFRAIGVYGKPAARSNEARDGRGASVTVERDTKPLPRPEVPQLPQDGRDARQGRVGQIPEMTQPRRDLLARQAAIAREHLLDADEII
jgi:hypothetical protein